MQQDDEIPGEPCREITRAPRSLLDPWRDHLQRLAPPGADIHMRNGVGDAFRHYMSYGTLRKSFGSNVASIVGDIGESGSDNPENEKEMDLHNNEAGIAAGNSSRDLFDLAMHFNMDASKGNIKVIDRESGGTRPTDVKDFGGHHGAPIDKGYQGHDSMPNDMSGQNDGTMVA